jgi:REP element-mobilizing transposase RayT
MEKIGIMIRKWDYTEKGKHINPSKKNLKRQILTLHRKLKKKDKIWTEYSIEKDIEGNKNHIHLLLHYTNKGNLYQHLSRFIGNGEWKKREMGLNFFDECNGKYGLIHTEPIENEWKYRGYINKKEQSTTLI